MAQDKTAREALMVKLFSGYLSSQMNITEDNLAAFIEATKDVSLEALTLSVDQFASGRVERNNSFPPNSGEVAANAREWQRAIEKRAGQDGPEMHNGLIECDWGHGRVDLRGLTNAEQDLVMAGKGFVNGKNLAYLPLQEIRSVIEQGDLAVLDGGKTFTPRLSRMP